MNWYPKEEELTSGMYCIARVFATTAVSINVYTPVTRIRGRSAQQCVVRSVCFAALDYPDSELTIRRTTVHSVWEYVMFIRSVSQSSSGAHFSAFIFLVQCRMCATLSCCRFVSRAGKPMGVTTTQQERQQ